MKKSGASLVVHALEQVGVKFTFGIPGVHNTELYDELNKSNQILPILVTHEAGGAFMADAISRTSDSIGTLVIVPAAGATHALSGIGEAFLDGVPMLIISGGVRTDTGRSYQLHAMDQGKLVGGAVKKYLKVTKHSEIIPMIYDAYRTAVAGEPGPVFVEVPVNIQLFQGEVDTMPLFQADPKTAPPNAELIQKAALLLKNAKAPGFFLGWGARDCVETSVALADLLGAPVSTSLQGLSVFPADHPLSVGMGFGTYSVPAGEEAFADCDCLLAVGVRFGEIPTGSFGMKVPQNLVHIDINPEVFDKNFKTSVAIEGDAGVVLAALLLELQKSIPDPKDSTAKKALIKSEKEKYHKEWLKHDAPDRVNPARFFQALRGRLAYDGFAVVDDGNHTFLAEELLPIYKSKRFISPTDFNCMGYATPAAIGVKLAHPGQEVVAIVGDGAFLMTCMEILTASTHGLGIVYYVFHDGELSQISQGQEIPYNRKTCTVLGKLNLAGVAQATGAEYVSMNTNADIERAIGEAMTKAAEGVPVIVDVNIDYSKRTRFTEGVVGVNLGRFPLREKIRFILRALTRRVTG